MIRNFIFAGLGVTIGDILLGYWARSGDISNFILGLVFNLIGIIFYAGTLRSENIGIATAIFLAINIVAVTLAGIVFFRERSSILQIVGMGLILLAIVLMEI